MNIKELKELLQKENIPENAYSLSGGLQHDTYCIDEIYGTWEIYYTELGQKSNLKVFKSEDEACNYFYNWLKETMSLM